MRMVNVMVDRPCCMLSLAYALLILITTIAMSLEFLEFQDIMDRRAYLIRDDPIVMNRDKYELITAEFWNTAVEYGEENPAPLQS